VLGVQHAVEGGLDVARGERCAVVELHALAELDLPGRIVEAPPRHREARAHLTGLEVARREMVEDVVAENDALAEHRVGRIPVLHVALERVDDRVVLSLRDEISRHEQGRGQQKEESKRGDGSHDRLLFDVPDL
jgi:hypothetical protein